MFQCTGQKSATWRYAYIKLGKSVNTSFTLHLVPPSRPKHSFPPVKWELFQNWPVEWVNVRPPACRCKWSFAKTLLYLNTNRWRQECGISLLFLNGQSSQICLLPNTVSYWLVVCGWIHACSVEGEKPLNSAFDLAVKHSTSIFNLFKVGFDALTENLGL